MDQQARKQAAPLWRPFSVKASKARANLRHWISGPEGQRAGHFPTLEAAQAACDRLNEKAATA